MSGGHQGPWPHEYQYGASVEAAYAKHDPMQDSPHLLHIASCSSCSPCRTAAHDAAPVPVYAVPFPTPHVVEWGLAASGLAPSLVPGHCTLLHPELDLLSNLLSNQLPAHLLLLTVASCSRSCSSWRRMPKAGPHPSELLAAVLLTVAPSSSPIKPACSGRTTQLKPWKDGPMTGLVCKGAQGFLLAVCTGWPKGRRSVYDLDLLAEVCFGRHAWTNCMAASQSTPIILWAVQIVQSGSDSCKLS